MKNRCVLCSGPQGRNALAVTLEPSSPTHTIVGQVAICSDCAHTRSITPAHLFELGRAISERSVRRAQTT